MRIHSVPAWEVTEGGLTRIFYQQSLMIDALGRGATKVLYIPKKRICCFDRPEENDSCYMCEKEIPFVAIEKLIN